ncbi:MAG: hypothetical protein RL404_2009 [Pseudomonadota bacterium]|jgi:flagellar L-ring protein precursor FlgH
MAGLSTNAAQAAHVPVPHHPEARTLASIATRVLLTSIGCGALATLVALVAGCASVTPDSIVEPAPSKQAQAPSQAALTPALNGAIYAADNFRPMFEDRRARLVGDSLIINIAEKTSAGKNVASSSSKDGKADILHGANFVNLDIEATNALSNADKAAANAANNFTGTVTATVVEVLTNGNLRVRGEKQVAFDRSTEFIRFSGVVNPANVSSTNTVSSTSVADMRVEYRTNSNFDRSALQSALARFFLSILPL